MDSLMIGILVSQIQDQFNFETVLSIADNKAQQKSFEKFARKGDICFGLSITMIAIGLLKFGHISILSILACYQMREPSGTVVEARDQNIEICPPYDQPDYALYHNDLA
jgi:hypothetical protein